MHGLDDSPAAKRNERWLAFGWSLSEATFFFIVPEVLLTRIALQDFRRAAIAAGWSLLGALLGGAALWLAADSGALLTLLHFFERLPGINRALSFAAAREIHQDGVNALITGAFTGLPYKLLVTHANAAGLSLPAVLAFSGIARSLRFFGALVLAWLVRAAPHGLSVASLLRLHTLSWAGLYVVYFVLVAVR